MTAYDQGAPLSLLAEIVGEQGWQLVPTQWHRAGQRAANTPVRGVTGSAPFHAADEMVARTADLELHLEGGPDCTCRFAKPAVRPPLFVTGLDIDDGYAGKSGGDTLVELEMQLGPLPATWSATARGQWSPSRRRWYRHPAGLVISDAAFTEHGGHIETIRTGHRYSWIAPAIHTRKGQVIGPVVWYGPDQEPTDIPHVDDLPEFPPAWVDYFRAKAAEKTETPIAVAAGGEPGTGRPITPEHADNIVGVLTRRLHEMPPSGGEFRNTVFGLAAALARREVARGGTTQAVMDEMLAIFATHPMGLGMDADDVHWTEDGIAEGWSSPWRFVETTDHLTLDDVEAPIEPTGGTRAPSTPGVRRLKPTLASAVRVTRQRWLWALRIVLGGLTLLAGREGLGKSTIAVNVVADVTTGLLDGEYNGEPKSVVYIATEDARDTTIVPRLIAAGADLDRVLFVDAVTTDEDGEFESQLVLPTDVAELAQLVTDNDVALVVLDAATSVIDGRLDGDKDRQMRRGLEGIARGIGERTGCAVLGIVHFGKRDSGDTGKLILGSIAWSQVARSVLAVARDDDTGNLIISATKSNLAPGDAASLEARLVNATVHTEDGPTNVGRVEWLGETSRNARDLLAGPEDTTDRTERDEAQAWLEDYLTSEGKTPSAQVKAAAKKVGIAERTLHRARQSLGVVSANEGFPRQSHWSLPGSDASPATDMPRARDGGTTGTTGPDLRVSDATTGTTEPVVPTHVHGTTGGATAPVRHITDRWRVSGEPA